MADFDNVPAAAPKEAGRGGSKKKTVEETYQKLSQLEHILLRPDTYIGSAQKALQTGIHVWDAAKERIVSRDISFAPGLYKIFDEILVNAADHMQRCTTMKNIRVEIEPENCRISVWNDGTGIPVEMHDKEGVYVPELIFGHLLTSSNYDDDEKKVVGGRNGYGAKLANIFSTQFIVETADADRGKVYKQTFRDNMSTKEKPSITNSRKKKEEWTKITFFPDLPKFGMDHLDDDIVSLMTKRVYDIAGTSPGIRMTLNGTKLSVKSFKDYIVLYHEVAPTVPFIHEKSGERWEIAVGASQGQLEQVSFVNSIWTIKGGNHVGHVVDQVVSKIQEHVAKKNKGMKLKPHQVKSHLSVFVNALIENPAFDSQTKETLTSKPSQFGSKCVISDDVFKKILKSGVVENVTAYAVFKQSRELTKTDGGKKTRLLGVAKLDDANKAGSRDSSKCTLILTEGDSAKGHAVSGLSIVGRDYFGVFPLRGKLLNVREASHKQIMDNSEICNLKKIIGLQQGKKYTKENIKSLRYGHVMIMTDQDHDGSHIKGLLINFFDHFWPELLEIDGFLQEFITPIVKGFKGRSEMKFFTIPQYERWAETAGSGWRIKYYKGIGTSRTEEVKDYFSNLPKHLLTFKWTGEEDNKNIQLAFAKARVNDRKQWLTDFEPGTYFDSEMDELNYSNFINKELILFSMADNIRSIPSVVDGLKPSQRKVLYACFKRKLTKNEIKLFQLSGYIAEQTAYHHGDASLQATIVGLAQNFVGSNNINLLEPDGQFGTRLQGGKDCASARYICTKLAPIARAVFPELDDPLLEYLEDEGLSIEPKWYCPIIPLVLANGADGIGTGWSSQVPCYQPRDLIANVRRLLNGDEPEDLLPWYRGFDGTIQPVQSSQSYDVYGAVVHKPNTNIFSVRELPVRSWTTPYKEFLESQTIGNPEASKVPRFVQEFSDHSSERSVKFDVTLSDAAVQEQQKSNTIHKKLKLVGSVTTSNMMLFDPQGRIAKYGDTASIFKEFFAVRMDLYCKRKAFILNELQEELDCLDNKQRFILYVVDGKLKVAKRKKKDIVADLIKKGFKRIPKTQRKRGASSGESSADDTSDAESEAETMQDEDVVLKKDEKDFDYLLSMPIWSLTLERVEALLRQRDSKHEQKEDMLRTAPSDLWLRDLDVLEGALDDVDKKAAKYEAEVAAAARAARRKQKSGGRSGAGRAKAKAVVYDEADAEDEIDHANIVVPPSTRKDRTRVPRRPKAKKEESIEILDVETKPVARPKKAPRQKKAPIVLDPYDSEESDFDEENLASGELGSDENDLVFDDDDDDDDDEVIMSRPRQAPPSVAAKDNKRATRRAVPRKVVNPYPSSSEDDDANAMELASPTPASKNDRHRAVNQTIDVHSDSSDADDDDADEDDRANLSLAERLALRGRQAVANSKPAKAGSSESNGSKRPRNARVTRKPSAKAAVIDLEMQSPSPDQKKKRSRVISPAPSKKGVRALPGVSDSEDEVVGISDDDSPVKASKSNSSRSLRDTDEEDLSQGVQRVLLEDRESKSTGRLEAAGGSSREVKPAPSKAVKGGRAPKASVKTAKTAPTVKPRKPAPKKAPAKKPAGRVSKKKIEESEDSADNDDDVESLPKEEPSRPLSRPRRAPARKTIIEISSDESDGSGEEEDPESEFEVEDDSQDSDFD